MPRPPLMLIEWEDAYNGDHDWIDPGQVDLNGPPMLVTTVGFELQRNAERITLAMSLLSFKQDAKVCDLMTIPIGMIRKERRLR
jgi:hypothetical protein